MLEADLFEQRLASGLRAYAAEVPTDVHAVNLARSIAAAGVTSVSGRRFPPSFSVRWMVVGALVAAGALLAALALGSAPHPPFETPRPTIDGADGTLGSDLAGGPWYATPLIDGATPPLTQYTIDFAADVLISKGAGTPLAHLGRAVSYTPIDGTRGRLVISAPSPCGVGSYIVAFSTSDLRFTERADSCDERGAILQGGPWKPPAQNPGNEPPTLVDGQRYHTEGFTEPFTYVAKLLDPDWGGIVAARTFEPGTFVLTSGRWGWELRFLDDWPLNQRPCETSIADRLVDVPSTLDGVAEWLRAMPRVLTTLPVPLQVDGRPAMRFDVDVAATCGDRRGPWLSPGYTSAGEAWRVLRVYAIDTGDDMILCIAFADPGSTPPVLANADELILSIEFE